MNKLFYNLYKIILGPIFLIWYRPKMVNKHLIPKKGPIILAGNHIHILDQCLPILSTSRFTNYMAKKEYFDNYKTRWFFKSAGCISVDRDNKGGDSLKKAKDVLLNNGAIGIFPEGTRNKTNNILLPFKKGTIILAKETNSYIVPFVVTGKYKIFNNNLKVEFLKPFKVNDLSIDEANKKLEKMIRNKLEV